MFQNAIVIEDDEIVVLKKQRDKILHDRIYKISAGYARTAANLVNPNALSEDDCVRKCSICLVDNQADQPKTLYYTVKRARASAGTPQEES